MPERSRTSPETHHPDLINEKQALFERLKHKIPSMHLRERAIIMSRLLEHSLDDGLALAKALHIPANVLRQLVSDDVVLAKHEPFFQKIKERLDEELKEIGEDRMGFLINEGVTKLFFLPERGKEWISDAFRERRRVFDFMIRGKLDASAQELYFDLDAYYAKLLTVRRLKLHEQVEEVVQFSGVRLADRHFVAMKDIVKTHYVRSELREWIWEQLKRRYPEWAETLPMRWKQFVAQAKKEYDVPFLSKETLESERGFFELMQLEWLFRVQKISTATIVRIASIFLGENPLVTFDQLTKPLLDLMDKTTILPPSNEEWKNMRHRVLDVTFCAREAAAKKLLKQDLLRSLEGRGYDPDSTQITWDETKKEYRVIGRHASESQKDEKVKEKEILDIKTYERIETEYRPDKYEYSSFILGQTGWPCWLEKERGEKVKASIVHNIGEIMPIDGSALFNSGETQFEIRQLLSTQDGFVGLFHDALLQNDWIFHFNGKEWKPAQMSQRLDYIFPFRHHGYGVLEHFSSSRSFIETYGPSYQESVVTSGKIMDENVIEIKGKLASIQIDETGGRFLVFGNDVYPLGNVSLMGKIAEIDGVPVVITFDFDRGDYALVKCHPSPRKRIERESLGIDKREFRIPLEVRNVPPTGPRLFLVRSMMHNRFLSPKQQKSLFSDTSFDKFWFLCMRDKKGNVLTPAFDRVELFEVTEDFIVISGMIDDKIVTFRKELKRQKQAEVSRDKEEKEIVLTDLEKKLKSDLELLETYDPVKLEARVQEISEERPFYTPAMNEWFQHSIRENPALFLDTIAATPDVETDIHVMHVIRQLFPELEEAKKKKQREERGMIGSLLDRFAHKQGLSTRALVLSTQDYLRPLEDVRLRDGDPQEEKGGEIVLELREPLHDLLVTQMVGSYDKENDQWKVVHLADAILPPETPMIVRTCKIPSVQGFDEIRLPRLIGSRLIRERVHGLLHDGTEVALPEDVVTEFSSGEISVRVPKKSTIVSLVYSLECPMVPRVPQKVTTKFYLAFRERLMSDEGGRELLSRLAILPPEAEVFLQSVKELPLHEQAIAIEAWVREKSFYDLNNKDVQQEKDNVVPEDRFLVMRHRVDTLREKRPDLRSALDGKLFAGVCFDMNVLLVVMLRRAGFAAGILNGFRASGKIVRMSDAHAAAFIVWPGKEIGEQQIIPLDGTPRITDPKATKQDVSLALPSLEEKQEDVEKMHVQEKQEAEKTMTRVEQLLLEQDMKKIAKLSNGELERLVNRFLQSQEFAVAHLHTLRSFFHALRFSGWKVKSFDRLNLEESVSFFQLMEDEAVRISQEEKSGKIQPIRAPGHVLLEEVEHFVSRTAENLGGREQALQMLGHAVTLAAKHLCKEELRAAQLIICYLQAKMM